MKRILLIGGTVVAVLVLSVTGIGVYRQLFPSESWRIFQSANDLVMNAVDFSAIGTGGSLYISGEEACGGMFWAYDHIAGGREVWDMQWLFFVDLDNDFLCPVNDAAIAVTKPPIPECPACVLEEYEQHKEKWGQ